MGQVSYKVESSFSGILPVNIKEETTDRQQQEKSLIILSEIRQTQRSIYAVWCHLGKKCVTLEVRTEIVFGDPEGIDEEAVWGRLTGAWPWPMSRPDGGYIMSALVKINMSIFHLWILL